MNSYLDRLREKELLNTKIVVITKEEEKEIYQKTKNVIDTCVKEQNLTVNSDEKLKIK